MSTERSPDDVRGYRPQAVDAMTSHDDIEQLLPVTSWRGWLIALSALLLIGAAVLYASADARAITVTGPGRVTDGNGIRLVTATVDGQVATIDMEPGDKVAAGQVVASVTAGTQVVAQRSPNAGLVIGPLVRPGDAVNTGDWIMEIASTDADGMQALVTLNLEDGHKVSAGQPAEVFVVGSLEDPQGSMVTGKVVAISDPLRSSEVEIGLAMLQPPEGEQIVAAIKLDERLAPGSIVDVTITVSRENLLRKLLGLS